MAQSISATTHSITLLPVLGSNGYQHPYLFVQLGEPSGHIPKTCYRSPSGSQSILEIAAGKSHIMGREQAKTFYKNVLFRGNLPPKILLILDNWTVFRDHKLIRECCPAGVELFIKNIPSGATSLCQPADLSYHHAIKGIQRSLTAVVLSLRLDFQLSQRNNLLRFAEQVHWSLGAERFKGFISYGFYKGGFIPTRPDPFVAPKEYLFGNGSTDTCSCSNRGCTLCPHCSKPFCFNCYWEKMHRC